jgi:predicted RNA-binding protein (virulence factor B family)
MKTSFKPNQRVTLLIASRTEMGFTATIDGTQEGILYKNEVFQPLKIGQQINGYIKKIRDDGKIDLSLQRPGYKAVDALTANIMYKLRHQKGFLAVTDKSRPEVIADLFGVSKKVFKKAIGNLYKKRLISLEEDGIRLTEKSKKPTTVSQKKYGRKSKKGKQQQR